jgi:ElaA protein
MTVIVKQAALADLDSPTLYAILKLRMDVFIVEQQSAYPDIDGLDAASDTLLVWAEDEAGHVLATIRVLGLGAPVQRIGRVATAADARGRGLAAVLMRRGLELTADADTVLLGAQSHLEAWYGRFGFVRDGEAYDEDGIPHIPMSRPRAV